MEPGSLDEASLGESAAASPRTGQGRRSYLPQALGRGLAVLDCFDGRSGELTAMQLARRTGVKLPTLYRYLAMLEAAGFVQRMPAGRYALGFRLVELGGQVLSHADAYKFGQPLVEELANELQLDVHLAQLYEGDVLHLGYGGRPVVPRRASVRATTGSKLGERTPAHCTSLGKAMLAHVPAERVESTIRRYGWRPLTSNSIQDFPRLERELGSVRSRGFAIDREEKVAGIHCLAVPVFRQGGRQTHQAICAVSATGPAQVFQNSRNIDRISQMAMEYAQLLSARIAAA
jgi:IclR family transcriptional regulator, KDG regulon repressor